ncbi:MAG: M23 family metallopeptidase [Firmicutes bacterium]|nr:M23 family metallopeptidase [Bacillota bacterium]
MRSAVCLVLVVALSLVTPVAAASGSAPAPQGVRRYQPVEVAEALAQLQAGSKNVNTILLADILMPTSMGIQTPKINVERITNNTPISELSGAFLDSLVTHGVKAAGSMTYSEFKAIEATWPLTAEGIRILKELYPELSNTDMSTWTYGTSEAYCSQADKRNLAKRFSDEQLRKLNDRGIRIEDTFYLFKEFHDPETILAQSDETLKGVIEGYYKANLSMSLGTQTVIGIQSDPPPGYYTYLNFPGYGYDWFSNDIATTDYWMSIQSARALRTQQVLYSSTDTNLHCTNMYGTYSQSQNGAHEGIDFAIGTTPSIYATFRGVVLSGGQTGQLSVYDANAPEQPKTYTYLHMSYKAVSPGSNVAPYDYVGNQGNVGNATGYHVHFEVEAGSTTALHSELNEHHVQSLSPYQLQSYIGP